MSQPTIADIIADVAAQTGVSTCAITGPRRTKQAAIARTLAMAAIKHRRPNFSLLDIAEAVGRTDHSTAYYGLCRYMERYERDECFRQDAIELGIPRRV